LSGRGLCDELITRPEESYRLWCVVVCDLETSRIGAPYIYNISCLRVRWIFINCQMWHSVKFIWLFKKQLLPISDLFSGFYMKGAKITGNGRRRSQPKSCMMCSVATGSIALDTKHSTVLVHWSWMYAIPSYTIWQDALLRLYFRWIFCFREDKEKVNIVDHEDDDTVAFNLKDTWYFNQDESGNLTGDENITIPNVLLLVRTMVLRVWRSSVRSFFEAKYPELIWPERKYIIRNLKL